MMLKPGPFITFMVNVKDFPDQLTGTKRLVRWIAVEAGSTGQSCDCGNIKAYRVIR